MFARTQFSLLLLFILSLFVASRSSELPAVIELQRCQFRCLQRDLSPGQEHLCLVQCHQTYLQEHEDRGNVEDPQIEDPKKQYEQCQRGCSRYEGTGQRRQKQYCLKECRDQYEEQRKAQEEREQRGGDDIQNDHQPGVSPEQKYRQCQQKCQSRKEMEERKSCQQRCKEEYSKEGEREGEGREHGGDDNLLSKKKEEEKHEKNPYFFEEGRFQSRYKTEEGHFRVLERFSEKSGLLEGIGKYRLAVLEANPCTFIIPHHCDAEAVFVVANGQGTITFVQQQHRESFNLKQGDAITVPPGSTVYLINRDNNEKLYILMLVHPINTPGHFEEFFGAGGEEPQSFYRVFSNELLEAALNTPKDKFEKVIGKQKKGVIIKASQEHIRALSQDQEETAGSSSQEQGGEARGPFNILQQQPLFSNEYGQFLVASPDTNEQLRRLGFSVAFMIINRGAMIVPYHNTRSTEMVVVVGGKAKLEMACPHLGRHDSKGHKEKKHEKSSVQYQKISARLSVGDVFINPAGHPISIVSSGNENLILVVFGVNAQHNYKHFLAGRDNIWNQVRPEAKELSFGSQATAVEEVFGSQEKSYFVPGPKQGEEEKGQSVASILDFVGFI